MIASPPKIANQKTTPRFFLSISTFPENPDDPMPSSLPLLQAFQNNQGEIIFGKGIQKVNKAFHYATANVGKCLRTGQAMSFNFPLELVFETGDVQDAARSIALDETLNKDNLSTTLASQVFTTKKCSRQNNFCPVTGLTWLIHPDRFPNLLEDDWHWGYRDRYHDNYRIKLANNPQYLAGALAAASSLAKKPTSARRDEQFYQVGGVLHPTSPSYIERECSRQLLEAIKLGKCCTLIGPRHNGKSSLCCKTAAALERSGYNTAKIDLSSLGINLTAKSWYANLIYRLLDELKLDKIDPIQYLEKLDVLSGTTVLEWLLKDLISSGPNRNFVLFFDEIDVIEAIPHIKDNFIIWLRSFYNNLQSKAITKFSFVLSGVRSPAEILDQKTTPFNIGSTIKVGPLFLTDCHQLQKGLKSRCLSPEAALKVVLQWSGGQPLLTQKICQLVSESPIYIEGGFETKIIDKIVSNRIISNYLARDPANHFGTLFDALENSPHYSQIINQVKLLNKKRLIPFKNTATVRELLSLGLIKIVKQCQANFVTFANPIYAAIFSSLN